MLEVKIKKLEKIKGRGIVSAVRLVVYLFDRNDRFTRGEKLVHYLGLMHGERAAENK